MITTIKEKENEKETILEPICYSNVNMFWGGIIAEVLARLGVQYIVISPGSRSGPLAVGCANNKKLKAIPILDERSAGFFGLGLAKQTHRPVALICSSGTAAANFYPAIIEARMSKVPLIVLTADRPGELRECHSGQTIDQIKLFGDYPAFYKELTLPEANIELFYYLRQTIAYAFERAMYPQGGPVHLNVPFRDPLAPVRDEHFLNWIKNFDANSFFDLEAKSYRGETLYSKPDADGLKIYKQLKNTKKGLIIVGTIQVEKTEEFVRQLVELSNELGWPVLAEGLSPVRNYESQFSNLITRYDVILRNNDIAQILKPEQVIQIGNLPTSKVLRAWLKANKPKTWVFENSSDNNDPLHGNTTFVRMHPMSLMRQYKESKSSHSNEEYSNLWKQVERQADGIISEYMSTCDAMFEGKAAWLLSKCLPKGTNVFAATSMPVRDVEYFWQRNNLELQMYFNRGANGIDGLVSTALGIAHCNKPSVLLIGDLSLLHDTNGLLIKKYFQGSLTIILINNNGGRLFEFLPIAQFRDIFEEFFATPQDMNFKKLAHCYGLEYYQTKTWEDFRELIKILPERGIRVIELITDSHFDVAFRKNLFKLTSESMKIE